MHLTAAVEEDIAAEIAQGAAAKKSETAASFFHAFYFIMRVFKTSPHVHPPTQHTFFLDPNLIPPPPPTPPPSQLLGLLPIPGPTAVHGKVGGRQNRVQRREARQREHGGVRWLGRALLEGHHISRRRALAERHLGPVQHDRF